MGFFCRPDASFEALKQKLESVMPAASGTEQASSSAEVGEAGTTSSSTTSIQRSVTASAVPAGASMAGTTTTSSTAAALPINQESITANSDIRPMFSHSTSVDQSLEPASASASAAAPKRKDEAFADLEQNLQNTRALTDLKKCCVQHGVR